MKTYTKFLFIFFYLLQISAFAQWNSDTSVNNPICNIVGYDQFDQQNTSDGNGGAIIAWVDGRSGSSHDIYAQRINADGYTQWATNGVPICTATGSQTQLKIISDGASGAIITWVDTRNGNWDIYAQRINDMGLAQWTTNGIVICNAANFQNKPRIIPYQNNGAIISWTDRRNNTTNDDIYSQRIDGNGTIQWATNGVIVCTECIEAFSLNVPQLTSDDITHDVFYTWPNFIGSESDISVQKLNSNGVSQWTANGISICNASNLQKNQKIISDTNGGIIICWEDNRTGTGDDIYAQRVNTAGNVQWATNGIVVCSASRYQDTPNIISDDFGGAYLVWGDDRSFASDIYAQRINSSGNPLWLANGIPICTAAGVQTVPKIVLINPMSIVIVWEGPSAIYAQNITPSGNLLWATDGVFVTNAAGSQYLFDLVKSDANNAIVSWQDDRNGSLDIYSSKLNTNGTLGFQNFNTKLDISFYPNPTKDIINIKNPSNFIIEKIIITDLKGKTIMEQNGTSNDLNVSQLQQGMYLVEILSNGKKSVSKIIKQ